MPRNARVARTRTGSNLTFQVALSSAPLIPNPYLTKGPQQVALLTFAVTQSRLPGRTSGDSGATAILVWVTSESLALRYLHACCALPQLRLCVCIFIYMCALVFAHLSFLLYQRKMRREANRCSPDHVTVRPNKPNHAQRHNCISFRFSVATSENVFITRLVFCQCRGS